MANFKEVFSNQHAVLPVIHVQNEAQVLSNLDIAQQEGADGIFLIDMQWTMRVRRNHLYKLQKAAVDHSPNFFIGINDLSIETGRVFNRLDFKIPGVWVDNAEIISDQASEQTEAWDIQREREKSRWNGLYFGGVAFKYTDFSGDVAFVASVAKKFMDVVTTSGDGTGIAPRVDKIISMKNAIGDHPLGIASGMTPENVHKYTSHADAFLVASSLLISHTEDFDKFRVRDLVSAVRGK